MALGLSVAQAGAQPTSDLIQKLEGGADFRVRVQAALELGKTRGTSSRIALEGALDDENAAVRAAAAAALKVMRDPTALAALQRHEDDASASVRAQIKSSVEALSGGSAPRAAAAQKPDVLVQVGKIRSGSSSTSGQMLEDVARTSKQKLRELPGVAVMDESKDGPSARRDVPLVMVTGRVKQLEESREGTSVVYLASVEFVLHKMPGQSIKGVVSGSARASGSAVEMGTARAIADLRRSALEAAIDSAVRRAPQALRAAAQ
ncbi:MAG TPA: HEAT repeat domain-containing protein [Polyangiaceae bacterium]|nr:HEAT repeat domain-containing protein [Polyangiaceae bacterium]